MRIILAILGLLFQMTAFAQSFDHSHEDFTHILERHVVVYDHKLKSAVDYEALAQHPNALNTYLKSLADITPSQYQDWTDSQQLAFLINAYNAFTLQLIISHYERFQSGDAESIRELGGLFSSPWGQSFFSLLGDERSLDWLEHKKIRVDFDEPRIHAALVCAAISCPKLRSEAYTAAQLEEQLDDQMLTFLSDDDKNGIDANGVYLSKIFDWYSEDFSNLRDYLRQYSDALANSKNDRQQLQSDFSIRYMNYNWSLNGQDNL